LWGEIATQLLLAAPLSCRAARSRCALQLHSFEQLLVVVMRQQLTLPWAARRNFGTHSIDSCLPITLLSSSTLQSVNLARPAEGIFMRQQHNANVRSNPLNARLSDAASRKRVGSV